ncbi:DJ-1/PfpI family protein [Pseudorhodoferax sp. Leaf274]|uniref:DJ-1/PfpI family protein n=1 Tax=Pseudorhodoferax sp. Leaf274 TaxID=1736318 RepID=UPI0007038220|nr:DJ-1/PfpI family protein [Pseudorhodoferax sp. Leaf274]KQP36993.1 thiamine biosynthesis protein ThiJ [Pseudorhodoferax sp. Leaf274]
MLNVGILVFDEVEALDFAGPYEVFTTAVRMHARLHPGQPAPFAVRCIARGLAPVRARAGLRVLPDADFESAPPSDLLIVPGGVVDGALACPATIAWIAQAAARAATVASVCTGAFLLAQAGLLGSSGPVTTHWEDLDDLRSAFPALQVQGGPRWVPHDAAGRLWTSAGISAGLDLSLHLVARLTGQALAERTARQMDYAWRPTP